MESREYFLALMIIHRDGETRLFRASLLTLVARKRRSASVQFKKIERAELGVAIF
jgi:hypothetical protein